LVEYQLKTVKMVRSVVNCRGIVWKFTVSGEWSLCSRDTSSKMSCRPFCALLCYTLVSSYHATVAWSIDKKNSYLCNAVQLYFLITVLLMSCC